MIRGHALTSSSMCGGLWVPLGALGGQQRPGVGQGRAQHRLPQQLVAGSQQRPAQGPGRGLGGRPSLPGPGATEDGLVGT